MKESKKSFQKFLWFTIALCVGLFSVTTFSFAQGGFEDDFSSTTLDPAWEIWPGWNNSYGSYSITNGALQYMLSPWQHDAAYYDTPSQSGGYTYYPGLLLARKFSGEKWTFETKVNYNMPWSNGRGLSTEISIGNDGVRPSRGRSGEAFLILIYRNADQAGYGASANKLYMYAADASNLLATVELPLSTTSETYYFKIIRDGYKFTLQYSTDGVNYTQAFIVTASASIDGKVQKVVIGGNSWATPAGSYEAYDYIKVKVDTVEIKAKPTDTSTLKLGERKTFEAITGGQPIKVKWTTHAIDQPPAGSLFPNDIGIFFDPDTDSSKKEFQTVHLGEVELIAYDPVTLKQLTTKKIKVEKPSKLGTTNNQYDSQYDSLHPGGIIEIADKFGIPPQIIKGQIEKESGFNSRSYRYEPGYDRRHISIRQDLRNSSFYSPYRMEYKKTIQGVTYTYNRGADLDDDSRDQRNIFDIMVNGNKQKITKDDQFVSVQNIWDNNNVVQHWSNYTTKPAEDFSAQTTLAASYGLMQVMYPTAIERGFRNKPPSGLFDVEIILDLGCNYLVNGPRGAIHIPSFTNGLIRDVNEWFTLWEMVLNRYNGGIPNYGVDVMENSKKYQPQ